LRARADDGATRIARRSRASSANRRASLAPLNIRRQQPLRLDDQRIFGAQGGLKLGDAVSHDE
jgi:hypothetical protein